LGKYLFQQALSVFRVQGKGTRGSLFVLRKTLNMRVSANPLPWMYGQRGLCAALRQPEIPLAASRCRGDSLPTRKGGVMSAGGREYDPGEPCLTFGEDKGQNRLPSVEEAKRRFHWRALSCPLCKAPPEQLSWIYLVIPPWAGKDAEEKEGWVTICDRCKLQIDFFAKSD
jgi:hypothetical protein